MNAGIIAQLILQGLQQLQAYQQVAMKAHAEGRDVSDAELDALGAADDAVKNAVDAEITRQRAAQLPAP